MMIMEILIKNPVAKAKELPGNGIVVPYNDNINNINKEENMNSFSELINENKNEMINQTESNVNPISSADDASKEKVLTSDEPAIKKARIKKEPAKKEYKPDYSDEKKAELELVTKIANEQIESVKNDQSIPTYTFGANGKNCVIDITAAIRNGVAMLTPVVNRGHGKDAILTGESIRMYGAQQLALVITKAMADVAEMKVERFANDKSNAPIKDNSLVFLNGNGRMSYILGLEDEERPQFYATFIEPDALCFYNPRKVMEVINTERLMWKTQDMVQKRLLEEGKKAHNGWDDIQKLIKRGYKYQAACQAYTLDTDRIKSKAVTGGNAKEIFAYFESAKQIHDALVAKFGEGDDNTLKTKEFPKEINILWKKLLNHKGEKWATATVFKFIEGFKESKVNEIRNAKSEKFGRKKDEIRKAILNEQFNQFIGKEGIELD